jgi:hypothetical protein
VVLGTTAEFAAIVGHCMVAALAPFDGHCRFVKCFLNLG